MPASAPTYRPQPASGAPDDAVARDGVAEASSAAAQRDCPNCGAPIVGPWCPSCGQETRLDLPPARQIVREAAGRYVALDGRLWRTLAALLRPGFLTLEYFAGRRRRYVRPARLFVVLSLLMFAALRFSVDVEPGIEEPVAGTPDARDRTASDARGGGPAPAGRSPRAGGGGQGSAEGTTSSAPPVGSAPRRAAKAPKGVFIDPDEMLVIDAGTVLPPWAKSRVDAFKALPPRTRIDHLVGGTMRYGPYAMALLLPVFALLLKVAYLGRTRRYPGRPQRYAAHLVFAAHTHAFLFLAIALLAVASWTPLTVLGWIGIPVYLALAQKRVYGGGWLGVVARGAFLVLAYAVAFGLIVVPWLLAALFA